MVNTFLLSSNFAVSFSLLDDKRLGKQRVEAYQIINILTTILLFCKEEKLDSSLLEDRLSYKDVYEEADLYLKREKFYISLCDLYRKRKGKRLGFCYHPIAKMWCGYLNSLKYYFNCCVFEWIKRGYKNNMKLYDLSDTIFIFPLWISSDYILNSHISSLKRKNPNFYKNHELSDDRSLSLGYIWLPHLDKAKLVMIFLNYKEFPPSLFADKI